MLYRCFVVNTPMFFESHFDAEIKCHLSPETVQKISITGTPNTQELLDLFDPNELPKLYGGACECEATCVYSDRGLWADMENKIDFRHRPVTEMDLKQGIGS
jgi:hypothetical protein